MSRHETDRSILWRVVVALSLVISLLATSVPQASAQTYQEGPDYRFFYTAFGHPINATLREDWNLYGGPQDLPYYINNAVISAGYGPAVRSAFDTFEDDPTSSISFVYMGSTSATSEITASGGFPSDGINVVSFGSLPAGSIGRGGFGGVFQIGPDNLPNGVGDGQFDITLSSSTNFAVGAVPGAVDVESLVLHELGHALALDHPSSNSNTVMWQVLQTNSTKRNLHPADIHALSLLYPGFGDVPAGVYFTDAVDWASANGITTGTTATTFSPFWEVSRAQLATFLWRAAGEPAGGSHPFTDVPPGQYYSQAVAWMAAQGITTGTTATTFSPNDRVTRAQMATFLWRFAGQPAAGSHPFTDVPPGQFYSQAVAWMAAQGITTGTSATTFSPSLVLNRAQAVTFLWRYYGSP